MTRMGIKLKGNDRRIDDILCFCVDETLNDRRFDIFVIAQNKKQFDNELGEFKKMDQKKLGIIYAKCYKNINSIDFEAVNMACECGGELWYDWSYELKIFYICRYLLFKRCIPISSDKKTIKNARKRLYRKKTLKRHKKYHELS